MASAVTDILSSSQKMITGIITKITSDPLAYVMMGVPPSKRMSAAIYIVGFAVLYGFVMRMFFRAEDSLSSEELMMEEPLSSSDDVLAMLGEFVGSAVDAVTNTADVLSETLGVKPTNAARRAAKVAKQASRQAAAVRRTAWWHHFVRGLVIGLVLWNALAILAFPPSQDLLATYQFPEPKIGSAGAYSAFGRGPTPYIPYYRSPSSSAYKSSGVTWTPVKRCGM